jgi:hypothetical protein
MFPLRHFVLATVGGQVQMPQFHVIMSLHHECTGASPAALSLVMEPSEYTTALWASPNHHRPVEVAWPSFRQPNVITIEHEIPPRGRLWAR